MRIGILGGSFDPVHCGHLGVARAVADALALEKVLLMPAAQAPLRGAGVCATGAQRLAMLRAALEELRGRKGERRLEVDETELRRGGMSYTVDTLRTLAAARRGDVFIWIVGADQLARLGQWREPEELARLAEWAVYARPGFEWDKLTAPAVQGLRVRRVPPEEGAIWAVSSSEVRERLARDEDVRGLLPDKVIEYIRENGLYRPH